MTYESTGEVRAPRKDEWFLSSDPEHADRRRLTCQASEDYEPDCLRVIMRRVKRLGDVCATCGHVAVTAGYCECPCHKEARERLAKALANMRVVEFETSNFDLPGSRSQALRKILEPTPARHPLASWLKTALLWPLSRLRRLYAEWEGIEKRNPTRNAPQVKIEAKK